MRRFFCADAEGLLAGLFAGLFAGLLAAVGRNGDGFGQHGGDLLLPFTGGL